MDHGQYLLLMAACLVVTLPLELVLGARVWRRPRALLGAVLPVAVVFSVWDAVAIARGTWTYSRAFTTGIHLPFRLPLEELVFFLVIPVCGLLTYEAVGRVVERLGRARRTAASADAGAGADATVRER